MPLAEVEGRLTLDSRPLEGAEVQFVPEPRQGVEAPRSTGVTDPQGHFKLDCDDGRAGAMVGQHRVAVLDLKSMAETAVPFNKHSEAYERGDAASPIKPRFPESYSNVGRTPLRKEVKTGKQTIDVELKAKP